ncbi:hypothetical protein D3C73_1430650 [compost metagenome]
MTGTAGVGAGVDVLLAVGDAGTDLTESSDRGQTKITGISKASASSVVAAATGCQRGGLRLPQRCPRANVRIRRLFTGRK